MCIKNNARQWWLGLITLHALTMDSGDPRGSSHPATSTVHACSQLSCCKTQQQAETRSCGAPDGKYMKEHQESKCKDLNIAFNVKLSIHTYYAQTEARLEGGPENHQCTSQTSCTNVNPLISVEERPNEIVHMCILPLNACMRSTWWWHALFGKSVGSVEAPNFPLPLLNPPSRI